jgi:amidase
VRGLKLAGEILAALGHDVHEVTPALPGAELMSIFVSAFGPAVALGVSSGVLRAGREPQDDEIEPLSRALYDRARATSSVAYLGAVAQLQAVARGIVAFFADYDVLLTPALAERPLPIGECNGLGERPMEDLDRSGRFTPYTSLFNITGQPAISVPMGLGPDGLPTGVQIVGKPLCEDTLLQLAAQLEAAHPWAHLRPEDLAHR